MSRLMAIAVPITSAISVAMMAASAMMYRKMFSHRGRKARHAWARLSPLTVPSLMARDCRKMAKMLLSNTINSSRN